MKESELAVSLGEFSLAVRNEIKGLSTKIVWCLYGSEDDFVQGGEGGEELEHGMRKIPKERQDWETYVLLYGAGAIQGHVTGAAERKSGGGYSGKFEEKREIQYIHQLLARNASTLKVRCGLNHPALSERIALMNAEPHRTAAILFFQEYLRSIYRSVAGADAEILIEHLKRLPGDEEPSALLAKWKAVEAKLKAEKRSAVYDVKDGRFFVYEKSGKKNRMINGWIFGMENEEGGGEGGGETDGDPESDYDRRIVEAPFHARMNLLLAEGARLLGDPQSDLIGLAAEFKSGALGRLLASVDHLADLAESNMLDDAKKPAAKAVVEKMDRIASVTSKRSRLLARLGAEPDVIKERHLQAQKLKRKI